MTALEAGVWVETVTEGGQRFMAAWRKEEANETMTGKVVVIVYASVGPAKRHHLA